MKTPESHLPTESFSEMEPDARLSEMMLYVAKKSQNDPSFGATKLNKILFFADFCSYEHRGRPITGAEYMKLDKGPVPRRLLAVKAKLTSTNQAEEKQVACARYSQKRLVPLREPNLNGFSPEDIAYVDKVISCLRDANASDVSDLSHNRIWRIAGTKETIPYLSLIHI